MENRPIGGKLWRTGADHDDIQGMEDIKGALEALLFVADEPLVPRQLAEAVAGDEGKVLSALQELRKEYESYNRGMQLREVGGGWRMHTHPAYAAQIEKLLLSSRRARLTRAAVETLAIIAYLQPITRTQIANLRGVQSEGMVKVLEEQGLVSEAGKERSPGGPALYVTSEKFLERFGLNCLDDLPPLEDFAPDRETVQRIARSLAGHSAGEGDESDAEGEDRVDRILHADITGDDGGEDGGATYRATEWGGKPGTDDENPGADPF
ncbi:MAG: SMC-Scp complex subunit ScpB [Actinobacteria bacterium]|jgi:segregation and condensation protein B|nr:MAG: SMC-Scp complex subunit ScpB [Actinomycetota bacterium]